MAKDLEHGIHGAGLLEMSSGRVVDVNPLCERDVVDSEIIYSLSQQCRFGGHQKETWSIQVYTVAQHLYECARRVPLEFRRGVIVHDFLRRT